MSLWCALSSHTNTGLLTSRLTLSEEEIICYLVYTIVILDFPLCAPNITLTRRGLRALLAIHILSFINKQYSNSHTGATFEFDFYIFQSLFKLSTPPHNPCIPHSLYTDLWQSPKSVLSMDTSFQVPLVINWWAVLPLNATPSLDFHCL